MKEFHLHPDNYFIIRENGQTIAEISLEEALTIASISLPQGCTEVLVATDGIVYGTVNKAQEGLQVNPLAPLIAKEAEVIAFYEAKKQAEIDAAALLAQQLLDEQEPQE